MKTRRLTQMNWFGCGPCLDMTAAISLNSTWAFCPSFNLNLRALQSNSSSKRVDFASPFVSLLVEAQKWTISTWAHLTVVSHYQTDTQHFQHNPEKYVQICHFDRYQHLKHDGIVNMRFSSFTVVECPNGFAQKPFPEEKVCQAKGHTTVRVIGKITPKLHGKENNRLLHLLALEMQWWYSTFDKIVWIGSKLPSVPPVSGRMHGGHFCATRSARKQRGIL